MRPSCGEEPCSLKRWHQIRPTALVNSKKLVARVGLVEYLELYQILSYAVTISMPVVELNKTAANV